MKEKRGRGRPKFKLDTDQIKQLEKMAGIGMTMEQMAAMFDMSKDTLENLYKREPAIKSALSKGRAKASAQVLQTLFNMAASGKCIAATIFWTKVRERWKEPVQEIALVDDQLQMIVNRKKTFVEFCEDCGYPAPFEKQLEMRSFVFDDEGKTARLLLGSRGYGKTDYTTILGTAYKLYENPKYRILILTKSDEKNAAIVEEITKALKFNGVKLEKDNAHYCRVVGVSGKDHSVSALTIGSTSLRGRHPDLIIMDDPVTEEDVSEATRTRLQRKYNELTKLCQNIAIIGQPVHVFDLYETLRPLLKLMEVPHGTIPELDHDLIAMKLAGVSEVSINASYHLKVTSEIGNPLSKVQYLDKFPDGDSVAFIDPSFRGGDYTAMSVGRQHFDGIAIQGFAWKKSWEDCLDDIKKAVVIYNIKRICFETNCLGSMPLKVLREALKDLGVGVVGRDSTGYKHSRIMAAGTFAQSIFLSKTSHRIYIDQTTKYEYGSKYDDSPDSLASLLDWIGLIRGKK